MRSRVLLIIACVGFAACDRRPNATPNSTASPRPWFRDITNHSGIDFRHIAWKTQRFWMPEISSGGLAFLDYDDDGWLDLYAVQSGDPSPGAEIDVHNRLFRNLRNGTFTDVTAEARVGDTGYGHGVATGDVDNDGDVDLYVANLGANVLYQNEGTGTFADVTPKTRVGEPRWSTACSFVDYDLDGDLDLFVVNNLDWAPRHDRKCQTAYGERDYCVPRSLGRPTTDTLYRNDGDGTLRNVSEPMGITTAEGIGLGVVCADFDGDNYPDIYVANDGVKNHLWRNRKGNRFEEVALQTGCALNLSGVPEASMGVQAFDSENDGDWDLFMTHVLDETHTFYRNRGGSFSDDTTSTGTARVSAPFTGFGMGLHDFDHDGNLDLFVANGRVYLKRPYPRADSPYAEPNHLFRGAGGGRFVEIAGGLTGTGPLGVSRAAAFGDIDQDGDVDIAYLDLNEPLRLLRNDAPKEGAWIALRLLNRFSSDALGAVVELTIENEVERRLVHTSYSYCAANDPRVHFGLGASDGAPGVVVTWPDGSRERYGPLSAGRYHTLRQGKGREP